MKRKLITILLAVVMLVSVIAPMSGLVSAEGETTIVVYDGMFNFSSVIVNGVNIGGANELTLNLDSSAAVEGAQVKVYAVRYIPGYNSTNMPKGTNIAGGTTLRTNEIGFYFDHYKAIPHLAADVKVDLEEGLNEFTVRLNQILDRSLATKIEVVLPAGEFAEVALEGAPVAARNVPGIDYTALVALTPSAATAMNNLPSVVPADLRAEADAASFSLAERYNEYFMVGNVNSSNTGNTWSRKHWNVYTAENNHKPSFLMSGTGAFTLGQAPLGAANANGANLTSDTLVSHAIANNSNVIGHVLLWHGQSQNAQHPGTNATRAVSMQRMENYIRTVVLHYDAHVFPASSPRAGERVFIGWDVVNEAYINEIPYVSEEDINTPGSWKQYLRHRAQPVRGWENAPGSGTGHLGGQATRYHWYDGFANGADVEAGESGADFIYWGFVFARRYTDVELVYNDFNIYEEGKALMVAQMVNELNAKYLEEQPNAEFFGEPDLRPLIDVVGLQGHWYLQDTPARDPQRGVQRALDIIRATGARVHISELDMFVYFPENGHGSTTPLKNKTLLNLDNTNDVEPYWRTRFGLPTNVNVPASLNFGKYMEAAQAEVFAEYFAVLMENADIVDRVTFWGLRDTNSWRNSRAPLLWYADIGGQANPKLSYYAVAAPEAFLGLDPIAPPETSVRLVRVTPGLVTRFGNTPLAAGADRAFTATVLGNNNPAKDVIWEVQGGVPGTTISADGILSVAPYETAERLTIVATSVVDPSKSGKQTLIVNNPCSFERVVNGPSADAPANVTYACADEECEEIYVIELEPEALAFSTSSISIKEVRVRPGTNEWIIGFTVTETYVYGDEVFVLDAYVEFVLTGNNVNQKGVRELGRYTLAFDIAGNGSNIKLWNVTFTP